jgi:predicted transcriptional regulator
MTQPENTLQFRDKFKELRQDKNISARKLDRLAGVTRGSTTMFENGDKDITLSKLMKLVDALDAKLELTYTFL